MITKNTKKFPMTKGLTFSLKKIANLPNLGGMAECTFKYKTPGVARIR